MKKSFVIFLIIFFSNTLGQAFCADGGLLGQVREKKAFETNLIRRANLGNPEEQCNLGYFYKEGQFIRKNHKQARIWFAKAANKGYSIAQNELGVMFQYGQGGVKNYAQAKSWYEKSALQGNKIAQNNLANLFMQGQGVPKNRDTAIYWYEKAYDSKNSAVQYQLAQNYYSGINKFPKDPIRSAFWYEKVATQGNKNAQNVLGLMYLNGQGVALNREKAFYWLEKGCDTKSAAAQYQLSLNYSDGTNNFPIDFQRASKWLNLSASKGYELAVERVAYLQEQDRREKIEMQKKIDKLEAELRAQRYRNYNYNNRNRYNSYYSYPCRYY